MENSTVKKICLKLTDAVKVTIPLPQIKCQAKKLKNVPQSQKGFRIHYILVARKHEIQYNVACQAHPALIKIGLVLARLFHFNSLLVRISSLKG